MKRVVLIIPLLAVLLGCSQDKQPSESIAAPAPTGAHASAPIPYWGVTSIEERIATSSTVVRARLANTTTEVVTTRAAGWNEDYYVAVKFHLSVSEYLHGSGSNSIVAIWVSLKRFDTRKEAQDAAPGIAAQRNTQWDARESVLFLGDGFNNEFGSLAQVANTYLLASGSDLTHEDFYSLTSRFDRRWLPSTSATPVTPPSDSQEFLLEAQGAGSKPATITLGELKTRVAAVNTELNGGDGSDVYKDCVRYKYKLIRRDDWRESTEGKRSLAPKPPDTFASGQAAGAALFKYHEGLVYDGKKSKFWLEGQHSTLFTILEGPQRANRDLNRDGQPDGFLFDQNVVSVRPLPQGAYTFNTNLIMWLLLACGYTYTYEVTANVTAPAGTLHEAFFDPVTATQAQSGQATVAADSTNGVLKPASFTDANGASATIQSIAYESPSTGSGQSGAESQSGTGTVKLKLTPHTGLTSHVVDFIALDGSVILSLDADDATVDAANNMLSWSVSSQPWEHGDMLMLRIHDGPVTSVPTPAGR